MTVFKERYWQKLKTFGMRKPVLFKAGESKLGFILMPKAHLNAKANKDTLSKITQGFSLVKEKYHLILASGLNLVNKELPPGSRTEKKNGGDQVVRSQSQGGFPTASPQGSSWLLPKINQTL